MILIINHLSLSFAGLLYVRQVPHLNCLANKLPDHKDLAFKLKRKQFTIEVSLLFGFIWYNLYNYIFKSVFLWFAICPLTWNKNLHANSF